MLKHVIIIILILALIVVSSIFLGIKVVIGTIAVVLATVGSHYFGEWAKACYPAKPHALSLLAFPLSVLLTYNYRRALAQFQTWLKQTYGEKRFKPAAVTPEDLRSYRSYLLTVRRQKAATVNRCLSALSRFFALSKARGWSRQDPADGLKIVPQVRPAPKALDRLSLRKLLRAVYQSQNLRDIAIVEVLLNTGVRVGELGNIGLEDVSLSERKGSLLVRGKGEKHRTVSLNRDARRALRQYLKVRPTVPTTALFVSGHLRGLDESTDWRLVKKYARKAAVEATPHILRHTFGTRLVREQKIDLVTVARLMGHENVNTTAIYAQATAKDLEDAVEALADGSRQKG